METTNYYDVIVSLVYTVGFLIMFLLFKNPISSVLRTNKVKVSIAGLTTVSIAPKDAGEKISRILTEFRNQYNSILNEYQKDLYRKICQHKSSIQVKMLIDNFDREEKTHIGALRALRGIGLIVPENDGKWSGDSYIVLTKFGREVNDFLKDSL